MKTQEQIEKMIKQSIEWIEIIEDQMKYTTNPSALMTLALNKNHWQAKRATLLEVLE